MAQNVGARQRFCLKQSEIDAYRGIDWLEQVFIVLFRIVDVATDRMARHLGSWERHEEIFQVRRSRVFTQPERVCFRWQYHRHPVMNFGQQLIRRSGNDGARDDCIAV